MLPNKFKSMDRRYQYKITPGKRPRGLSGGRKYFKTLIQAIVWADKHVPYVWTVYRRDPASQFGWTVIGGSNQWPARTDEIIDGNGVFGNTQ